jgi:hypothetical protein
MTHELIDTIKNRMGKPIFGFLIIILLLLVLIAFGRMV